MSERSDAKKLLAAIAEAKRCAVALHEEGDNLPGKVGDVILLFPSGGNIVATESFIRNAALIYLASLQKSKEPWKRPQISREDIPRATRLVSAMRDVLRTRHNAPVVIPPKNWRALLQHCRELENA